MKLTDSWDNPEVGILEFPDDEKHFTFFKSVCKEHLFSMTKTGKIFEVCTDKKNKFKLMRVL